MLWNFALIDLGFDTFDDLLIGEPSMKDLETMGIQDPSDREAIYYEIYPELALAAGAVVSFVWTVS